MPTMPTDGEDWSMIEHRHGRTRREGGPRPSRSAKEEAPAKLTKELDEIKATMGTRQAARLVKVCKQRDPNFKETAGRGGGEVRGEGGGEEEEKPEVKQESKKKKTAKVAFICDATGSMKQYLDGAKQCMEAAIDAFNESDIDVEQSVIVYRDHKPQDMTFVAKGHRLARRATGSWSSCTRRRRRAVATARRRSALRCSLH